MLSSPRLLARKHEQEIFPANVLACIFSIEHIDHLALGFHHLENDPRMYCCLANFHINSYTETSSYYSAPFMSLTIQTFSSHLLHINSSTLDWTCIQTFSSLPFGLSKYLNLYPSLLFNQFSLCLSRLRSACLLLYCPFATATR